MNKQRRQTINRLAGELQVIAEELDRLSEQEREAYDALPENLQQSERGELMDEYATTLYDAKDSLDDIVSNLANMGEG